MSSGSYITIYRKLRKNVVAKDKLDAIREEYYKSNKGTCFNACDNEESLRADMPILLEDGFSAEQPYGSQTQLFYDKDGVEHFKLLSFHFLSSFTCLKEHLNLNPYTRSRASAIISAKDAKDMLQAAKYVLSGEYSRKFEEILSNDYVELFGEDYPPYVRRFKKSAEPIYVEREERNFKIVRGDYNFEEEEAECTARAKHSLETLAACLEAFMRAECYDFDGEELVLEYSAY